MPTYLFRNTQTDEITELVMSISSYDQYKKDNPHMERYYDGQAPAMGDPVRLGVVKPPSDFQKYVVGRIKESVPGNKIVSKFGIPGEH